MPTRPHPRTNEANQEAEGTHTATKGIQKAGTPGKARAKTKKGRVPANVPEAVRLHSFHRPQSREASTAVLAHLPCRPPAVGATTHSRDVLSREQAPAQDCQQLLSTPQQLLVVQLDHDQLVPNKALAREDTVHEPQEHHQIHV